MSLYWTLSSRRADALALALSVSPEPSTEDEWRNQLILVIQECENFPVAPRSTDWGFLAQPKKRHEDPEVGHIIWVSQHELWLISCLIVPSSASNALLSDYLNNSQRLCLARSCLTDLFFFKMFQMTFVEHFIICKICIFPLYSLNAQPS